MTQQPNTTSATPPTEAEFLAARRAAVHARIAAELLETSRLLTAKAVDMLNDARWKSTETKRETELCEDAVRALDDHVYRTQRITDQVADYVALTHDGMVAALTPLVEVKGVLVNDWNTVTKEQAKVRQLAADGMLLVLADAITMRVHYGSLKGAATVNTAPLMDTLGLLRSDVNASLKAAIYADVQS